MRQPKKNDFKIQVRMPKELKEKAEEKLTERGLSISEYLRRCLEQLVVE